MKIIVSQIGKQHTNALLIALAKHNILARFFTSIAANKISFVKYLGDKVASKFKKLNFVGIERNKISHFPFIALSRKIITDEYWVTRNANKWFDTLVATKLKKADFDIFIGYENANLLSFKTAKQRGKITVLDLASVHHSFQNPVLTEVGSYKDKKKLAYISHRKEEAYNYTDYIICISSFAEKTLIESGFKKERIYKTYLGINQKVFTPKERYNIVSVDSGELIGDSLETTNVENQTWDNRRRNLEIYFVGTLSHRKGLPFMMEVLKILVEKKLNIRLTLIGPIEDFDVPQINAHYFRYIPFLPHADLVKLHHALDLFIFPSNIDSWAQVVVEAMACGSPVLVSENTGAKDAVSQGGGLVLPVGDLNAWVKAIEYFYYDRANLQKVGVQAVRVAMKYTWESYHDQIFEAMKSIKKRALRTENKTSTHRAQTSTLN